MLRQDNAPDEKIPGQASEKKQKVKNRYRLGVLDILAEL